MVYSDLQHMAGSGKYRIILKMEDAPRNSDWQNTPEEAISTLRKRLEKWYSDATRLLDSE